MAQGFYRIDFTIVEGVMDLSQVIFVDSVQLQSIRAEEAFHKVTYLLRDDKISAKAIGI